MGKFYVQDDDGNYEEYESREEFEREQAASTAESIQIVIDYIRHQIPSKFGATFLSILSVPSLFGERRIFWGIVFLLFGIAQFLAPDSRDSGKARLFRLIIVIGELIAFFSL